MATTNKKTYKLDIFKVLDKLSRKNYRYYSSLTEEEQKAVAPLVIMRWLTGTTTKSGEDQILALNERANPYIFSLQKHKELLMHLLASSCNGTSQRYSWKKAPVKKTANLPLATEVVKEYYNYNSLHAIEALPLLADSDIIEYAFELGKQPDFITKLKRELKKRG